MADKDRDDERVNEVDTDDVTDMVCVALNDLLMEMDDDELSDGLSVAVGVAVGVTVTDCVRLNESDGVAEARSSSQ